jgi:DNA-binding transcriptional ArsR family regulator
MTGTGKPRTITDPRMLRALSHPVRLALLDALRDGPLTATQAGATIGETPTTCSFHLRQLANYGFVEEAGGGVGRARPWRLLIESWDAPARPGDPEFMNASRVLDHVLLGRQVDRMRRFIDTVSEYPESWQRASTGNTTKLHMTADELTELAAAYRSVMEGFIERFRDRAQHPERRPEGSLPVETFFAAYPAKPVEPAAEE